MATLMAIIGVIRSMLAQQFALTASITWGWAGDHCRPFNGSG